jgi:hypothetical protein
VLWGEVGEEMTDLIKRDDALAAIDTFKRDFEQSWKVQFSADIAALPAIDPAAIREAALREAYGVLQNWLYCCDAEDEILALIGEVK